MSNDISLDRAIEIGVQAGVKEALDRIEKVKNEKIKHRHDRRLRNTKLLLKNYNNFKEHCDNAVYTSEQLEEKAIDMLDEYEDIDDESIYINSIKKTKERTYIILKHIDRMIEFYKYNSEKTNDSNAIRRYKAIEMFYFSDEKMTYDDIAEVLTVSERTIFRDIKQAVEDLSALLFGIDGIKLEI